MAVTAAAGTSHQRAHAFGKAASVDAQHGLLRLIEGIPQSNETLGRVRSPVVLSLYGDLECPVCRELVRSRAFARLIAQDVRTGTVRIVYSSLCTATCNGPGRNVFIRQQVAAYAAGIQGRFWQYALLFLQRQGPELTNYVNEAFLDRLARDVPGLSYRRWLRERRNPALASAVMDEDRSAGRQNIIGTPTLTFSGPHGVRRLAASIPSFKAMSAALAAVS